MIIRREVQIAIHREAISASSPRDNYIQTISPPPYYNATMSSLLKRFAQSVDYVSEMRAPYNTDGARSKFGTLEKKASTISDLVRRPVFELSDLPAYWDALQHLNTVGLDDRELLLEKVLVLMARLEDTVLSNKIQKSVISLLYKDLPHPPSGYLRVPSYASSMAASSAKNVKYAFRSVDGTNYNPLSPSMGKANMPYARSVPSLSFAPVSALPDPGLVFDTLLRREEFVPHPGGISSLFFAFANLVIHSIFNTNHGDWTINDASSYLDLSILYGSSQSQVDQVRRKDGTGRLWEDVFSESRLLFLPPSNCALLVLLSRNHNYIANKILQINERGAYSLSPKDDAARAIQDDEIFERARLVNCGYFMQIILGDYVGAILGLVRDECGWRLDPLMAMRERNHDVSPRGEGNVVSIEFNLLYRWHSSTSAQDAAWTGDMFKKIFEGKDLNKVSIDDFKSAAHKHMIPPKDVRKWTFDGLVRGPDGRFKDDDLARILQDATQWRAGAFQARGTPEVLRVIEIMGIEQGRSWGTCSLNEFRSFMGLKPYDTFEEWNSDEKIHSAAATLYKDINNLELYVGLQAEQAKSPGPGAGLCPGYTISRAILADAVSLTRGDRFLTIDFTPFNLTSWGYQDCQYDKEDGSYGGMLTKLLFRTLPDHYPAGSAYAHFPFLDPVYMKEKMEAKSKDLVGKYNWTRPGHPLSTVVVDTYEGVAEVAANRSFIAPYDNRVFNITKGVLSELAIVSALHDADERQLLANARALRALGKGISDVVKCLSDDATNWTEYFVAKTQALIKSKQIEHVGSTSKTIDIVKDVINLVPIHWISEEIIGLPLKSQTHSSGIWPEETMYEMFSDVSRYVFMNDLVDDWRLRESSMETCHKIVESIKAHFEKIEGRSITDTLRHLSIKNYHSHSFLKQVLSSGKHQSHSDLAAYVFGAIVPTIVRFSQIVAHIVDFYIDENQQHAREEIVRLSGSQNKADIAKVMGYVYEALRINPIVSGIYRTASQDTIIGHISVRAGQQIYANVAGANMDPEAFPDPKAVTFSRQPRKTGVLGVEIFSIKFLESNIPAILGAILSLKNIQRGPGQSGRFRKFFEDQHGEPVQAYINSQGKVVPWPDSLFIQFD